MQISRRALPVKGRGLEAPGPAQGTAPHADERATVAWKECNAFTHCFDIPQRGERTETIPMSCSRYDAVLFCLWFVVSLDLIANESQ